MSGLSSAEKYCLRYKSFFMRASSCQPVQTPEYSSVGSEQPPAAKQLPSTLTGFGLTRASLNRCERRLHAKCKHLSRNAELRLVEGQWQIAQKKQVNNVYSEVVSMARRYCLYTEQRDKPGWKTLQRMLPLAVTGAAWHEVWARSTTFGGNLEETPQHEPLGERWGFSRGGLGV